MRTLETKHKCPHCGGIIVIDYESVAERSGSSLLARRDVLRIHCLKCWTLFVEVPGCDLGTAKDLANRDINDHADEYDDTKS